MSNQMITTTPSIKKSAKKDISKQISCIQLHRERKYDLCQFFTPPPIAQFMTTLFENLSGHITLLEPSAGIGSLCTAFTDEVIARGKLSSLAITAYEIDPCMGTSLSKTIRKCARICERNSVVFSENIRLKDFITSEEQQRFSHVIMNPPYKKIRSNSIHRKKLSAEGIEAVNLYAGFLALAIKKLRPNGEMVAIVPRSFCNGAYYLPFRKFLLNHVSITKIHMFDARNSVFADDHVLQENIIIHCIKNRKQSDVLITSSPKARFYKHSGTGHMRADNMIFKQVSFDKIVKPDDTQNFIHLPTCDNLQSLLDRLACFNTSLDALNIKVSTGPVVAFRHKNELKAVPQKGTAPLLFPAHLNGGVVWPKQSKQPNAIEISNKSQKYLWKNNGCYVLTRRFSTKEEKKRIVANYYNASIPADWIGFENKLNVFHINHQGMSLPLAKGLYLYLNSSLIDQYYRQFSGHTQVNATDLRFLRYPSKESLKRMGNKIATNKTPSQEEIDSIINEEISQCLIQTNTTTP